MYALTINLKHEIAFEDVPPLVLTVMKVERWTAIWWIRCFHHRVSTAAVMAVVDAMGLLAEDRPFVHESLIGTQFRGRVAGRSVVGEHQAIVPEIEGSAWITGEHTFLIDQRDPLRDGIRI